MDLLEIVMLLIGILMIILSCTLIKEPEKKGETGSYEINTKDNIFSQVEFDQIKQHHTDKLSLISEEIIEKTEDYLNKLSNEKIMAVSEYSDQILDKINRNHEEVIFLYNMLNNKEKEMKETAIRETVSSKKSDVEEKKVPVKAKKKQVSQGEDSRPVSLNNTEILELYSKGKSIMDISRQLGVGQGEVKLIIDLFKDK